MRYLKCPITKVICTGKILLYLHLAHCEGIGHYSPSSYNSLNSFVLQKSSETFLISRHNRIWWSFFWDKLWFLVCSKLLCTGFYQTEKVECNQLSKQKLRLYKYVEIFVDLKTYSIDNINIIIVFNEMCLERTIW